MMNANDAKIEIDMNIKKRLENLLKKISNNLKSIFSFENNKGLNRSISIIKEKMIEFASLLEQLDDFRKEFFDFLRIEKMIRYTLDNFNSIDSNQKSILFESLYKFSDLIDYKLNHIENDYLEKYGEFSLYLKETKRHFYLNICKYDDGFDDTMIKVSKVLLG